MPADSIQLTSSDGTRLHAARFTPTAPRGGVVLVHGYADHGGRYAHVAQSLADARLEVIVPDLRGHGRSDGARGRVAHFDAYLGDLEAALAAVRAAGHARPFVLAHSMGGLVALRLLTDRTRAPKDVAGLVVTSPFLGVHPDASPLKVKVAGLMARVLPDLALGNGITPEMLSHDAGMIAARRADTLCFSTATPGWLTAAQRAQRETFEGLARLTLPSLWFIAGQDKLVDATAGERAFAQAGGDKTLVPCPTAYHEVLMEQDRALTIGNLIGWITNRI